jgi:hypothetical protein
MSKSKDDPVDPRCGYELQLLPAGTVQHELTGEQQTAYLAVCPHCHGHEFQIVIIGDDAWVDCRKCQVKYREIPPATPAPKEQLH